MAVGSSKAYAIKHPLRALGVFFVLWKIALLLIALFAPGIGYDTSTDVLLGSAAQTPSLSDTLIRKLIRWDAFYYVKVAERGYAWEQEWAFSWGYTSLVNVCGKALATTSTAPLTTFALVGILIAHVAHLLSAYVLFELIIRIMRNSGSSKLAFVTAALHIVSPAGLFLSAPYSESLFALFNFLGFLCYIYALENEEYFPKASMADMWLVLSGLSFGFATLVRGNGVLSGSVLAYHLLLVLRDSVIQGYSVRHLRRAASTTLAGLLTGVGLVIPQVIAYREYCMNEETSNERLWCSRLVPSITSWVQQHYWNNGFLRYWTLSNVPLFIFAAPTIYLLLQVDIAFRQRRSHRTKNTKEERIDQFFRERCLIRLAIPQVMLACLALTTLHVQIINRLASGYPLWYLVIAVWLTRTGASSNPEMRGPIKPSKIVRMMIGYAMVQGALYASFLPPA